MGQSTVAQPWRNERQRAARREEKRRARARKAQAAALSRTCPACGAEFRSVRARYCSPQCRPRYVPSTGALARRRARRRNREHLERSAYSDITPAQELAMRSKTRKCKLCGVYMTSKPGMPNSKHLDHIIPISIGGTHTHGNVRIICAACNVRRPKDGSDYTGPVTLWAILPGTVTRPHGGTNKETCRKGLHPWMPENIIVAGGQKRCHACDEERQRVRSPLRPCARCGTPSALPGSTLMCPACTGSAARKAAELHGAGGLSWNQVAALVGYGSGTGIMVAAKRAGYVPAPPHPKPVVRPLCACSRPMPDTRGQRKPACPDCRAAAARRTAEMYQAGAGLRHIANQLGYSSITSVSNLIKGTGINVRRGRPPAHPPTSIDVHGV